MSTLDTWLALRVPRKYRVLRHLLSVVGGFFWLPCPCCGEPFGGFEVGHRHLDLEPNEGGGYASLCTCRWCDTCAGADREQADLAALLGAPVEGPVRVQLAAPTSPEWRCGP